MQSGLLKTLVALLIAPVVASAADKPDERRIRFTIAQYEVATDLNLDLTQQSSSDAWLSTLQDLAEFDLIGSAAISEMSARSGELVAIASKSLFSEVMTRPRAILAPAGDESMLVCQRVQWITGVSFRGNIESDGSLTFDAAIEMGRFVDCGHSNPAVTFRRSNLGLKMTEAPGDGILTIGRPFAFGGLIASEEKSGRVSYKYLINVVSAEIVSADESIATETVNDIQPSDTVCEVVELILHGTGLSPLPAEMTAQQFLETIPDLEQAGLIERLTVRRMPDPRDIKSSHILFQRFSRPDERPPGDSGANGLFDPARPRTDVKYFGSLSMQSGPSMNGVRTTEIETQESLSATNQTLHGVAGSTSVKTRIGLTTDQPALIGECNTTTDDSEGRSWKSRLVIATRRSKSKHDCSIAPRAENEPNQSPVGPPQ
jgi:hypothetical protein